MNMMTVNPTKTIPPIKFGGNTSRALTPEEVQEFGRKIEAIRTETMAKIGKEDSDYIYKVRNFVRYTEIASRGMLMFGSWIPPVCVKDQMGNNQSTNKSEDEGSEEGCHTFLSLKLPEDIPEGKQQTF